MVLSCANVSACGSGARAALRLRALGGEENIEAPSAPAHPLDRARSASPEPRPKPGADYSGLPTRSGRPEERANPSDSNSTMDAPTRRSVKPTPRMRRGGSSSTENPEAVVGQTNHGVDSPSIEEALPGAANLIAPPEETTAMPCARISYGLETVVMGDLAQQPSEPATNSQVSENENPLIGNGAAYSPSFGDACFDIQDHFGGDIDVDAASHRAYSAVSRASMRGTNDNMRGGAMAAGTVHFKTMLNLPDLSEFSDDTSGDDIDGPNDSNLP
eukprot:TRINITY_DN22395_c0_g1_i1.p1 TRINITY_DN22395_c0_g1~~TRINITY_DN22395_c0_g1_i1.p1  ORF type:complete len:273 (+),score=32.03 TRINITY_DN22395_c0_g1_i1:90-908(+)